MTVQTKAYATYTPIEVGLYFDLRKPQHLETSAARLHGFTLEMCEEADRLGAGSLWFSEHHLFDDGYLTQPLTFAAAAAARTRKTRIGTAILIAPLHSPVEVAEQAALVDLISDGRVDLGIGAGYRKPEYELYGMPDSKRYATTDDMVRRLRQLWYDGGVTPRPVQDPLPVWLGYHGPQGARRAGLLGTPLLTPNHESWPAYREGLVAGGHDPAIARMGGGIQAWVTEDPERDWPLVAPYIGYQADSYRRHMVQGTDAPPPRPVDPVKLAAREPRGPLNYFWFGTPEDIAGRIRTMTGDAPVSTVFLWGSVGGMPEDMVAEHVRVVCTRLAPLLR
ncbi:LLM class flavin-dependent oxidoreductase [Nocardia sp. NPDC049526]|uniref:LLM class flavin-dependent oxidoreductase n=1 Tax=Nocardia sp. NPDC049526 TaxID=3364316 RepID=UPI00379D1C64